MILYSQWLALPINVRHKLAADFGIIKKTPTHVQDNVVVNDGYVIKEVEDALTVEAMQVYLGVGVQETDINVLWDMVINPGPVTHETNVVTDTPVIVVPPAKKSGRPKGSKNKANENQNPTEAQK